MILQKRDISIKPDICGLRLDKFSQFSKKPAIINFQYPIKFQNRKCQQKTLPRFERTPHGRNWNLTKI